MNHQIHETVTRAVSDALGVHHLATNDSQKLEVGLSTLVDVDLKPASAFLDRVPLQLSGWQRQRVGSVLVLGPSLLLADEPVSMLDVYIRVENLNLGYVYKASILFP